MIRRIGMTALVLGGSVATMVMAQGKAAVPVAVPEVPPTLSTTEAVAFGAVVEKLNANTKERDTVMAALQRIEAEIAAAHPGYVLDERTGALVKKPEPPPAATPTTEAPKAKPGA